MSSIKYSRQRESILQYLKETKEHPTAETVYVHVRHSFPRISLGTVYRNLNLLHSQGVILKINCGDGSERFDGNIDDHYHFICSECHRVIDLEMDAIHHIEVLASSHFTGEIKGHKTYFYGKCSDCIQKC